MTKLYKKILSFMFALLLIISLPCMKVDAATKLSKVKSFTTTGSTSSSITLAWKKVPKASGYQIQIKEDDEYYTIKTIKKADKTTYECQDLDAGNKYKFRIRAYKKSGSKKIYSSWKKINATTKAETATIEDDSNVIDNNTTETNKITNTEDNNTTETNTATNTQTTSSTVYTTATGKKYHSTKNCKGLNNANNIYEKSESDAINAGLTKCDICY